MVACLPLYPRFAGSKVADNNRFLRTIQIRNTASFGGEAKPSVPRRKILRHVKETYEYERDTSLAKFSGHFLANFLLLRC
jgi:hypothetical protein